MATPILERSAPSPRPSRGDRHRRRERTALQVAVAFLACFAVWALLDARSLQRSAESSNVGSRRDAALAVLKPVASISRRLGIDSVAGFVQRTLGRNPDAAPGGGTGGLPEPPAGPKTSSRAGGRGTGDDPGGTGVPGSKKGNGHAGKPLPPLRRPTPDDPLRLLVIGDSYAEDIGLGLARTLDSDTVDLTLEGKHSTGLSRPDYFDWFTQTPADIRRYRPEVVVAMFGGNDPLVGLLLQDGNVIPFGHDERWTSAYRRRVGILMDEATAHGARLAWVGLPIMGSEEYSKDIRFIDSIYRAEARKRPRVLYFDSWHLFTGPDGGFSTYLPNADGQVEQVRLPDGEHISPEGNDMLAAHVADVMKSRWGFEG